MAKLEQFYPQVWAGIGDCPGFVMEEAVREACILFCQKTQLIKRSVPLRVRPSLAAYELNPPEGSAYEVAKVARDEFNHLDPATRRVFEDESLDVLIGAPHSYYIEGDGRLMLGPIPDAEETLRVSVTECPASDATEVPDVLYEQWRVGIAAGARAYIRATHDQWKDLDKETRDDTIFAGAIQEANKRRANGGTTGRQRTKPQFF